MKKLLLAGAVAVTATTALSPSATLTRAGGSTPTISVNPSKVRIDGITNLRGSHLQPNKLYILLIAVPSSNKPKSATFISYVRTNRQGVVHINIHVPALTHCGPATLYAYPQRSKVAIHTAVMLTGCKASGSIGLPPAPPKKKP